MDTPASVEITERVEPPPVHWVDPAQAADPVPPGAEPHRTPGAPPARFRGLDRRDLLAALVLAAAIGLFFPGALAGGVMLPADILYRFDPWRAYAPADFRPHNPNLGDVIDAMYPNVVLITQGWSAGRWPLWNPHTAGGVPLGTLITSGAFYPLNLLYVLLPVEAAFGPHAMLRLFIAGWFTYLFLRALDLDRGPALLGGVAYALCGWQVAWLGWPQTYVSVWLPAVLWAVERLVRTGRAAYVAALALAIALLLLGGFPSVAAYGLAVAGLWAGFRLLPALASRLGRRRAALRLAGLGLGVALGLVIGSPQVPTTLENLRESGYEAWRVQERAFYAGYHLPLVSAAALVVPRYYGDDAGLPFWGPVNATETAGYAGVLPWLLVPAALLARRRRREALFFALLAAGALSVVYGLGPLPALVSRLPVFNTSAGTRLLIVLDYALAVLAALGAEALLRGPARGRLVAGAVGAALGMVGLVAAVDVFWSALPDPRAYLESTLGLLMQLPQEPPHPIAAVPAGDSYQAANLLALAAGLLAGIGAIGLAGRQRRPALGAALLIGVLYAELWWHGSAVNTVLSPADLPPEPPMLARLRAEAAVERFRVLNLGTTLLANVPSVGGIDDVGGHTTAQTGRYAALLRLIDPGVDDRRRHGTRLTFGDSARLDTPLLDLLGVRYVAGPPATCGGPGRTLARQDESDAVVGPLVAGVEQGQSFVAAADGLDTVCVMLATYGGRARGDLVFHLRERPDGPDLVTARIDTAAVPDNTLYPFRFPPIQDSAGRRFYFAVAGTGTSPAEGATIWYSRADRYPDGERWVGAAAGATEAGGNGGDLRFRALATGSERWQTVEDATLTLWRNTRALPRAFLIDRVEVAPAEELPARLGAATFDPGRVALTEAPPPFPLGPDPGDRDARLDPRATLVAWEPGRATIRTTGTAPGLLVFTESLHPGWIASVDGKRRPVVPANLAFVGVWVEAGEHVVELRFEAPSLERGLLAAVGALGVVVGLCALDRRHRTT